MRSEYFAGFEAVKAFAIADKMSLWKSLKGIKVGCFDSMEETRISPRLSVYIEVELL